VRFPGGGVSRIQKKKKHKNEDGFYEKNFKSFVLECHLGTVSLKIEKQNIAWKVIVHQVPPLNQKKLLLNQC